MRFLSAAVKNNKRQLTSLAILIIIIVGLGFYLKANEELLSSLSKISLASVLWLIAIRILFMATNGLFLHAFAAKFGVHLSPKEWFGLAVVTTMGNYITPFSGGLIARAAYLKRRHAFPYAQFAASLAANYLVTFWIIGVIGLLAMITLVPAGLFSWAVTLWFSGVTIALSILTMLPAVRLPGSNRLVRTINTVMEGWTLVRKDSLLLMRLALYTLINVLLNGLSFWLAYHALKIPISFAAALLISLLAVFSILVNVTPGNLGLQEAVISLSSGLLGAGVGQGLLVALLIRATTLAPAFSLGPIFSFWLAQEATTNDGNLASNHISTANEPPIPEAEQRHGL